MLIGSLGIVVLDDLEDVHERGNPVFDLRLAEEFRGRGLGVPIVRELTALAFSRFPMINYRDGWPVEGAAPKASVAYAILRRDWETGTTTSFVWEDLEV